MNLNLKQKSLSSNQKNEFRTKTLLLKKIIAHPKDYYKGGKRKPEKKKN